MKFRHNEINLKTHMMVIKNPQNNLSACFVPFLMTLMCDIKINLFVFEPDCVKLIFL